MDLFSEEEVAKRAQRAARFGMPEGSGLEWKPPQASEDEEQRRKRAERFGVAYRPKDETGLMDVGAWPAGRRCMLCNPRRLPCLPACVCAGGLEGRRRAPSTCCQPACHPPTQPLNTTHTRFLHPCRPV